MVSTTWKNQSQAAPLFPDLVWSRPERADQAGKLLIIGGSSHGFANVIQSAELAKRAGIGQIKVLLPKSIERYLGHSDELLYVAATATGSFSKSAVAETKGYIEWADGLLLPGDLTHNAETVIFIETILGSSGKPAVLVGEAVDVLVGNKSIRQRDGLIAIASFRQLQQMVKAESLPSALLSQSTLEQKISISQELIERSNFQAIVISEEGKILVVSHTEASLTAADKPLVALAAAAAVMSAQFPVKIFEALTTAAVLE